MATNDIISITASWNYESNVIQNQFVYKYNGGSANAAFLGNEFLDNVIPILAPLISDQQELTSIFVKNMANPADFSHVTIPAPVFGESISEALPSRNAILFYSPTQRLDIRQGRKMLGVTTQEFQNASVIVTGGAQTAIYAAIITALGLNLLAASGGHTASPVIVKRDKSIGPSGKPVYTLPTTATSTNHYVANNWQVENVISTQGTRKLGRGA